MKSKTFLIPYGSAPAAPSEPLACRNGWAGNDGSEEAFVAAAWNEEALTVCFLTKNATVVCRNFANQSPVSDDSCVEVFIKPVDGGEYWNFEFNIAAFINGSHRLVRNAKTPLTEEECASVKRSASPAVTAPVFSDEPAEWTFTVSIPWTVLGVKPHKGMRMTGNFYACAGKAPHPYYLSWAPIDTDKPDFHRPEFFGDFILD